MLNKVIPTIIVRQLFHSLLHFSKYMFDEVDNADKAIQISRRDYFSSFLYACDWVSYHYRYLRFCSGLKGRRPFWLLNHPAKGGS